VPSPFPSLRILGPLLLVAVTSSLASPFGYASLAHVDYVTFILAKSCKLLPVMLLHMTVFRKRYPLYKYAVVGAVTAGVAVFTLHHPGAAAKASKAPVNSSAWGLTLLGINLLFDGLTNSTQDHIFSTFKPYTGPQMMVAQNILSTFLTITYLLLPPFLPGNLLAKVPFLPETAGTELAEALRFLRMYPSARTDLLGFCVCGAIGQLFIYATLARFSSLLLVTVTVTRKMLTMLLSVVWFGHALTSGQWLGVGLVFGGVGAEGYIARREKMAADAQKKLVADKKGR
jgi:solute carrier family 35 (UDP-galactose transporter), member B1